MSRFQIIRKLGEGGMAEVHLATLRDESGFSRAVALKKLKAEALDDPDQVDLFVREMRVACRLNHPNVVQVFDAGIEDQRPYLCLEYVDGPDLDTVIDALRSARSRLSPALVAWVGAEVCRALAYAYAAVDEKGQPLLAAHRDISPSNILISSLGAVKLADFGVVRLSTSATAVGIVKGKWEFFPPEIITGRPQDARGDLFALGISLYKLYALEHPFKAPTPQEHFNRARTEEAERPPGMPEGLWKCIRSAMERDPGRRVPDAETLAASLEGYLAASGERVGARQLSAAIRALPLPRHLDEHVSLDEEDVDPDDAPTQPDVRRLLLAQELRARGLASGARGEDEDDEETTETGVPEFTPNARNLGRALTGAAPALLLPPGTDRLFDELRIAREKAGLKMDLSLGEFQQLLLSHLAEIRRTRPGARVQFVLGQKNGKPVVVPRVARPK